jgi:hypothetical protein
MLIHCWLTSFLKGGVQTLFKELYHVCETFQSLCLNCVIIWSCYAYMAALCSSIVFFDQEHILSIGIHQRRSKNKITMQLQGLVSHCCIWASNFVNKFSEILPSDWYSCECVNHPSRDQQVWSDCRGEQGEPCDWLLLPDLSMFAHSNSAVHMLTAVVFGHHAVGSKSPEAPELWKNLYTVDCTAGLLYSES